VLDSGSKVIHALKITANHERATKKKRKQITQEKKEERKSKNFVDGVYGKWEKPLSPSSFFPSLPSGPSDPLSLHCFFRAFICPRYFTAFSWWSTPFGWCCTTFSQIPSAAWLPSDARSFYNHGLVLWDGFCLHVGSDAVSISLFLE